MLILLILIYLVFQAGIAVIILRYNSIIRLKHITVLCLLLAIYAWTHWVDTAWLYRVLPNKYGIVLYNPIPLLVILIFSLLISEPVKNRARVVLYGFLAIAVNTLFFSSAFYNPIHCEDSWDGICCLQTTDSTCAAAAAATLLRLRGITTNEEEMKELCLSGFHGTTLGGMYHGIRVKADAVGMRVAVDNISCDEFLAKNEAAIVYVMLDKEMDARDKRYSRDWGWIVGTTHAVVFLGTADGSHVFIANPGTGLEKWHTEALKRLWQHKAVYIQ